MDFWNWLVDLFTRMGNAQLHTVSANTGAMYDAFDSQPALGDAMPGNNEGASESINDGIMANSSGDPGVIEKEIEEQVNPGELASYISENPGLSGDEYLQYMSTKSDEYAEKYIDYLIEKQSIADANAYTANREDTAYQRLVQDLKAAGLNPAMMYGSSASIGNSGSAGVVNMASGANSRGVSNYEKIKKLVLAYMIYSLSEKKFALDSVTKSFGSMADLIKLLF